MPNHHVFTRSSVGDTEIEACFPLSHEVDSRKALLGIRNNLRPDGGGPELTLLGSTPTIRMSQHELDLVRYRVPAALSIWVGRNEERFRGIEEITHEVGKDIDDGFPLRETHTHLPLQFHRGLRGPDHQLPPTTMSTGGREIHRVHEPSHLKETLILLEPRSVLNTSEVTVSIIVQDRGNFR